MDLIAERLDSVADALTTVERRLASTESLDAGLGGAASREGAGLPGLTMKMLYDHWAAVSAARSREAADVAHQLARLADDVRTTARDYADTDAAVAHRIHRGA